MLGQKIGTGQPDRCGKGAGGLVQHSRRFVARSSEGAETAARIKFVVEPCTWTATSDTRSAAFAAISRGIRLQNCGRQDCRSMQRGPTILCLVVPSCVAGIIGAGGSCPSPDGNIYPPINGFLDTSASGTLAVSEPGKCCYYRTFVLPGALKRGATFTLSLRRRHVLTPRC
jgi:hypothetical protein